MATWEFVLRETDKGKGDHDGQVDGVSHADRRGLAVSKTDQLANQVAGFSFVSAKDQGVDAAGYALYYWQVDDPDAGGINVKGLCCYFNKKTYVETVQGYPRPLGGPDQDLVCDSLQIKEVVARLDEISKKMGDP